MASLVKCLLGATTAGQAQAFARGARGVTKLGTVGISFTANSGSFTAYDGRFTQNDNRILHLPFLILIIIIIIINSDHFYRSITNYITTIFHSKT
jgi:hypothetical protein